MIIVSVSSYSIRCLYSRRLRRPVPKHVPPRLAGKSVALKQMLNYCLPSGDRSEGHTANYFLTARSRGPVLHIPVCEVLSLVRNTWWFMPCLSRCVCLSGHNFRYFTVWSPTFVPVNLTPSCLHVTSFTDVASVGEDTWWVLVSGWVDLGAHVDGWMFPRMRE